MANPIQPKKVRYIKLGRGGDWEAECAKDGILRFGFNTGTSDRFVLCRDGKWSELMESFLRTEKNRGTATRFTYECRVFFEDDGTTLWITFMRDRLHWGFLSCDPAQPHCDGDGVFRRLVSGWQSADINGAPLNIDHLSGALTQLASYRGTSCEVGSQQYAIDRINGIKRIEVEHANEALEQLRSSIVGMMKLLTWRDFEILVDLVFSVSGWRRQCEVGSKRKLLDMAMTLPTTNETAIVQVKSSTDQAEFDKYVEEFEAYSIGRMFFVYHSSKKGVVNQYGDSIILVGPETMADMVVDAGLTKWLIQKVA